MCCPVWGVNMLLAMVEWEVQGGREMGGAGAGITVMDMDMDMGGDW